MNNKKFGLTLLIILTFIPTTQAFSEESGLDNQISTYNNTTIIDGSVNLQLSLTNTYGLFINPNYPTQRDMYLSTNQGVYLNRNYDANFNPLESLNQIFPNGVQGMKFAPNYKTNGIILAYDSNFIYVSNDRGDTWLDETPADISNITEADFGPNYQHNQQIYFITNKGLFRLSVKSNQVTSILESGEDNSISFFKYERDINVDDTYYVVDNNVLKKTESFGDTWFDHEFNSGIKDFEIKFYSENTNFLMVITKDNELYYSTNSFDFYKVNIPEEINEIISLNDFIIYTDQGFYISYNQGDTLNKLEYLEENTGAVTDFYYVLDGTNHSLYVINDNTLYRDNDLDEVLNDYMNGIDINYATEGEVISKNILDLSDNSFTDDYYVNEATLYADADLNEQSIEFYLSNDGENWSEVQPNESFVFENEKKDLYWKVVLSTSDTSVSPILNSVIIDYGVEEIPVEDSQYCAGFEDIAPDDELCPAIVYVYDNGIFEGYPDGTFGPDKAINRAETVKVISEGFDLPIMDMPQDNLGFSDVIPNEWYMPYLATAKEENIIQGYPDGTFLPEQTVNYVEMLKIFLETANVELNLNNDSMEWYEKYVNYAEDNDLLVGENNYGSPMSRGDVAELFYRWSQR